MIHEYQFTWEGNELCKILTSKPLHPMMITEIKRVIHEINDGLKTQPNANPYVADRIYRAINGIIISSGLNVSLLSKRVDLAYD